MTEPLRQGEALFSIDEAEVRSARTDWVTLGMPTSE